MGVKNGEGEGERNFDLNSKHMIFAYQVLRQSGCGEEKKWCEVGLQMQKVKRDSRLWRFEDCLKTADRGGSLCCGVQHPVIRVGCFFFCFFLHGRQTQPEICQSPVPLWHLRVVRQSQGHVFYLTEANVDDLIFMPLPKNENQPLYCLDIVSLFTTQPETTFN